MLNADQRSLAIEAKNKHLVLNGWLSYLNRHSASPLQPGDCDKLIYQMIHRAASAVAAGPEPSLAYLVFKPAADKRCASPDQIYKKLSDLWTNLGRPQTFGFHVVEISMTPTAAYTPLQALPKRNEATSEAVSAALQDLAPPLFTFDAFHCRRVGVTTLTSSASAFSENALVERPGAGNMGAMIGGHFFPAHDADEPDDDAKDAP
jgi:hypothetical protein